MEPIKDFCTAADAYMQHAAELNAIMKKYPPGKPYTPRRKSLNTRTV